jgi:hypothetical protein
MDLNRRSLIESTLATIPLSLAGCGEAKSNQNSRGESTSDMRNIPSPTLVSHDIQTGAVGGYELVATIKNDTNQMLNRAVAEVSVFNNNKRLARGRAAIIDLSAGYSAEETALLDGFQPDEVTNYKIKMVGETEDFDETKSKTYNFEGSGFRQRLYGDSTG